MDYLLHLLPKRTPKPVKIVELICERCGEPFTVPFWMVKKGRRFCKNSCRKQNPLTTLLERAKIQENGCWNYTGNIGWGGYGQIKVGKTHYLAHRLMWILWNEKPAPDDMVVRHTCIGNRRCINPDHLVLGTQKENIQDCIVQGRFPRVKHGQENINSKMTDDIVREMRKMRSESPPITYKAIASQFGVSNAAVWYAVNKKQWKHVA